MKRLYQWLRERATFIYARSFAWNNEHTIRTEVTVQQQERTLLLCGHGLRDATSCPLCGQALPAAAPEQQPSLSDTGRTLPAIQATQQGAKRRHP